MSLPFGRQIPELIGRTALFAASGFGLGYAPIAPGTFGAAGGLASLVLLNSCWPAIFPGSFRQPWVFAALCGALFLVGIGCARLAEKLWGEDSQKIVLDEWLGMWVAMLALPFTWSTAIFAFVLFRLFDISKPFPLRRAELLGGGTGVMLDDLLAGVYANLLLQVAVLAGWL